MVHLDNIDMKKIEIKASVMKPLRITAVNFWVPSFWWHPCVYAFAKKVQMDSHRMYYFRSKSSFPYHNHHPPTPPSVSVVFNPSNFAVEFWFTDSHLFSRVESRRKASRRNQTSRFEDVRC